MTDLTKTLVEQVQSYLGNQQYFSIHGGKSFDFLLGDYSEQHQIDMSAHCGIIDYQPSELFIKMHAGTRICEVQQKLKKQNQQLPTDFPQFSAQATIGGAIALGLTGSSRPFYGAIRDHILGCGLINGKAELLKFGGQVMKNVAGYDISRLLSGSCGTLGIIMDVTLKVIPAAESNTTLVLDMDAVEAISNMQRLARLPLPVSACAYLNQQLFVRLSGNLQGVNSAVKTVGGEKLKQAELFWTSINNHQHDFFQPGDNLWRVILPANSPPLLADSEPLIDWCGGQHWYHCDSASRVQQATRQAGGYASRFRKGAPHYLHIENSRVKQLQQKIKQAFDANNYFNPALYAAMVS